MKGGGVVSCSVAEQLIQSHGAATVAEEEDQELDTGGSVQQESRSHVTRSSAKYVRLPYHHITIRVA
jgi:hypothetical protein